ncbi:MAG: DUF5043 domain-containing protein [Prevotellaceae bacterium]|jgi:hypothetical protein|nr:DUF5043 domain-containing protein [Prevotellaceae bacterium]
MKTLNTLLLCSAIFFPLNSVAQEYYAPGKVINGNGFTYVCSDQYESTILLYNKNNVFTGEPQRKKDGSLVGLDEIRPYKRTPELATKIFKAISSCLTPTDRVTVAGELLLLAMYIDSNTGKITEIDYNFFLHENAWSRLAPEKFYLIEQSLKQNVTFEILPDGKGLNYNLCGTPVKVPNCGFLTPHLTDSTKFYEVNNGVEILHTCPTGLYFNVKKCTCTWSWDL